MLRAPALAAVGLLLFVGCTQDSASASSVAVTATDTACRVARTDLPAGALTLKVTNEGQRVTEVYVYAREDDGEFSEVVSEVEDITSGGTAEMTVELSPGTYEVACKPGQTGDGIRQRITVGG